MNLVPAQRRPPAATSSDTARSSSSRLAGVDGLRAFAALWVVLFHMHAFSDVDLWPGLDLVARSGATGVSLFLVLSGFCLYAPYAGGRLSRFRRGDFFRRRCRRLLPAYYVSLLVVLALHLLADGQWGLPRLGGRELAFQTATHLTMTHQFFPGTFYGLNGAYWSLGLEWQLYLTLPLLIIAVGRFGLRRVILVVFVLTMAYRLTLAALVAQGAVADAGVWATVVLPNVFLGRWSEFALGMVAAELYRTGLLEARARPLVLLAVVGGVGGFLANNTPVDHLLFGLLFFALLCAVLAGDNRVARVFSWSPLVALGVMSYSLYLVHQPVVEVAAAVLARSGSSPGQVFTGMLLLLPVLVLLAWVLFVTVESWSMSPAAATDPPRVPRQRARYEPQHREGGRHRVRGRDGQGPESSADAHPQEPIPTGVTPAEATPGER